jgi:acetylornithine/succinyldiaminopimelate/putrescine aminotransferase
LFRIKKTEIVDDVVVWAKGVGGGEGVWKLRARAVDFKQGT